MKKISALSLFVLSFFFLFLQITHAQEFNPLTTFQAHPFFHVHAHRTLNSIPTGMSPSAIKAIYNLPAAGGSGTIAIIDAYADSHIQSDLTTFSKTFGLPTCTTLNHCLTIHQMASRIATDQGWGLEESLDTQWAHAIAPYAKILLVEARSSNGNDLLNALSYATKQLGVIAVSMSWGGSEFYGESIYDQYFKSQNGLPIAFFASSGDNGSGVSWPAVSNNVVGVGGTTLNFSNNSFSSETAWSESGGGLSQYEIQPTYQATFGIPQSNGFRAVPDVSYDADPASGFAVYDSLGYNYSYGWFQVGGTSAGAPQWAAIASLHNGLTASTLYTNTQNFRDILTGTNGICGFYCNASTGYDYITGLGSPLHF